MNEEKDIRWIQRASNFDKSYQLLSHSLEIPSPNETEQAGIIQFFEMTFELAWKLLKDYLLEEGLKPKSPRQTLKQAFQIEIIRNGRLWLEALEARHATLHTYDENTAIDIEQKIRNDYFPLLVELKAWIEQQINTK